MPPKKLKKKVITAKPKGSKPTLETDDRGIPIIVDFTCSSCTENMDRGGVFSALCVKCLMPIFFSTVEKRRAYIQNRSDYCEMCKKAPCGC
jgi:hypothetical protein